MTNYLDQVGRRDRPTRTLRRTEVTKFQREVSLHFRILEKVGTFSKLPGGIWKPQNLNGKIILIVRLTTFLNIFFPGFFLIEIWFLVFVSRQIKFLEDNSHPPPPKIPPFSENPKRGTLILFAELTEEEERNNVVATGGKKKVLGGCATIAGWGHKWGNTSYWGPWSSISKRYYFPKPLIIRYFKKH